MRSLLLTHFITSIQRLTYPTGQTTGATWQDVNQNIHGHLKPMGEQQAAVNNYQWGRAFLLQVNNSVDLQEGDKVVIADTSYNVRGVASYGGNEPYKKAVLTLPEKA